MIRSPALQQAYLGALYRIDCGQSVVQVAMPQDTPYANPSLRPRQSSGADAFFDEVAGKALAAPGPGRYRAAIVTAHNPGSRRRASISNRIANRRLRSRVNRLGFRTLPSTAVDPIGHWPDEHGFCILGCSKSAAAGLAKAAGQAAFLWLTRRFGPVLVFVPN